MTNSIISSEATPVKRGPKRLREATLGGFAWSFGGSGAQAVLRVAVLAGLARLLTPADFGLLSASLIVVGLSEIFCFMGVAPAIVQRLELDSRHIRTAWTLSLLFGGVTTAAVYLAAPLIASFFRMENLVPVVRLVSVVFTIHGASLVSRALLQRNLRFKALAACEFAGFVAYAAVSIVLAVLGFGAKSLATAYLVSAGVTGLLILVAESHRKSVGLDEAAARDLLGFGAGVSLNGLLSYLATQGDNLVVGRWLGSAALGSYGRAYALMAAPVSIMGQVMDAVLFASVSRAQENRSRMIRAFRSVTTVVANLTLPLSVLSLVAAPEIVNVLLGSNWTNVVAPLQVLALGMFFRIAYKIGGAINRGLGAVYRMAWRHAVYTGVVLGGALLGQSWGLRGVAFAVLAGLVIAYLLNTGLTLDLLGVAWSELGVMLCTPLLLALSSGFSAWLAAEATRKADLAPWISLLVIASVWMMAIEVVIRLRPRWFIDEYTSDILRELSARLPFGLTALSIVLPQRHLKEIRGRAVMDQLAE